MGFLSQTWTLTSKNLLIAVNRHVFSTPFRAFILPVAFIIFLSFAKNIFIPPSTFGIGSTHPVRTLENAFDSAGGGRNTLVFVDNGFTNGPIANVINKVQSSVDHSLHNVVTVRNESNLPQLCPSSVRGVTLCFGAVVFHSSPSEGIGGIWNYTVITDWALGTEVYVDQSDNDAELYAIPLQHAVDFAIAGLNITIDQFALAQVQGNVQEYIYTSFTPEERMTQIRIKFMGTITNFLGVAFLIAFVGVAYQLTGFQAAERELEMSNLIEAMMPNRRRWEPQAARLLSYHAAFSIIYLPGWLVMGIIIKISVFAQTSTMIVILFHLTAGLALASFSILGAAFFKKSQLSGITMTLITLLLGVMAQVTGVTHSAIVAVMSLLFSPCAYVYFIIFVARYERQNMATDLLHGAPQNPWALPGIILWIFLVAQIIVYPVLGAMVEKHLYGTASEGRKIQNMDEGATETVQVMNFRKEYPPSWISRKFARNDSKTVVAVKDLSLTARKGQILVLLGANGSGKSTTLDCIAGLNTLTSGSITVDGRGGIGIAPQKNVLWDELTVQEHITIFNKLKTGRSNTRNSEIRELINAVDLDQKRNSKSGTLSGGQKRKLQMGMMFTGGSSVCCVDEVSSGLDPLSRRKIWDILLAERGNRTILMTTHFLDEADLLADQLVVLSKGVLRAEGSTVELKTRHGGGFRIHLPAGKTTAPDFEGFEKRVAFDQVTYLAPDSRDTAILVGMLEENGISDYTLEGPSIEDVFLRLAEEVSHEAENPFADQPSPGFLRVPEKGGEKRVSEATTAHDPEPETLNLISGKSINLAQQVWVLFRKRLTILRRNYLPYIAAILLPVIGAALVTLLLHKNETLPSCAPGVTTTTSLTENILDQPNYNLLAGPSVRVNTNPTKAFFDQILPPGLGQTLRSSPQAMQNLTIVDTLPQFNDYLTSHFANVTPGAFFTGSGSTPPTFAWKGNNYDIYSAIFAQNALDVTLTNISISTQYTSFARAFTSDTTRSLQLVIYFCLAMAAYPAFFALYPTVERIRGVRGLEYSNGVRSLPLWVAYIIFDWIFVIILSFIAIVIFAVQSQVWYHRAYLFAVFIFYGMTSTLLSYVVSLFAKTQLSAFALAAAGQAVSFLIYLVAYLLTLTFVSVVKIDSTLLILHYTLALILPIGNLARSMFVALNLFSTTCVGTEIAPNPFGLNQYGGPIFYFIFQIFALLIILLYMESNSISSILRRLRSSKAPTPTPANSDIPLERDQEPETHTGLVVDHLTKSFKQNTAVNNISFSIPPNQVFALLGPNGAGKSTTISLIRGDIQPSPSSGNIYIESIPINRHRTAARRYLGVCPQHDAIDTMTVLEHLKFYARIRGISDISYNVNQVLKAVGLESFKDRLAATLSGGNKRKLSLGIALMGNPTVLLLDEPSSGMDAASKRVMWKTLRMIATGRSILLTTHSMEEADALANRAGIMAQRMLAIGSLNSLRQEYGQRYYVHLVTKTAPHSSSEEMALLKNWVTTTFGGVEAGVEIEEKTYHGQMRFSLPISPPTASPAPAPSRPLGVRTPSSSYSTDGDGGGNEKIIAVSQSDTMERELENDFGITFSHLATPRASYGFPTPRISYGSRQRSGNTHLSPDVGLPRPRSDYWMAGAVGGSGLGGVGVADGIGGADGVGEVGAGTVGAAGEVRGAGVGAGAGGSGGGIGAVIRKLERDKEIMGLECYSVSPTTLDQVFLGIVGRSGVQEENYSGFGSGSGRERGGSS